MTPSWSVACTLSHSSTLILIRSLKSKHNVPVTLLTNDNNLAVKARTHDIIALAKILPNGQPLSAELLIRQALHGPLLLDNTFIRPKEGTDTLMLDLSAPPEQLLNFLPGLEGSIHANKNPGSHSEIAIDPETGAVVLVKNRERRPPYQTDKSRLISQLEFKQERVDLSEDEAKVVDGNTYADIMALKLQHQNDLHDEMDWE
jgi:hypothetical protein